MSTYIQSMSQLLAYAIEILIVGADYILRQRFVTAIGVVQRELGGRPLNERTQIRRGILTVAQGPQKEAENRTKFVS